MKLGHQVRVFTSALGGGHVGIERTSVSPSGLTGVRRPEGKFQ